ncbi:MAG TPA: hypothetical protein VFA43_01525 [Gemmatimonadaceae bacterium]|nr:hypothetical protein [Gemmatimonadaceae bacterium]
MPQLSRASHTSRQPERYFTRTTTGVCVSLDQCIAAWNAALTAS